MNKQKKKINASSLAGRRPNSKAIPLGLTEVEHWALDLVPSSYRRSVLDIGIGTGRTIQDVAVIFDQYIGIDVDAAELDVTRTEFPGYDLRLMDVRELHAENKFDCIFFSFNGIDYMDLPERVCIFELIKNNLNSGGYFIYSTHNIESKNVESALSHFFIPRLMSSWRFPLLMFNRLHLFWKQTIDRERGFARINDGAWQFSLLNAYRNVKMEIEELKEIGFTLIGVRGSSNQPDKYDDNDTWVYVVLKKKD